MANTSQLETSLATQVQIARSRLTQIEFLLFDPGESREYGTALIEASNKILDCALDISKTAAKVESAISKDRGIILKKG